MPQMGMCEHLEIPDDIECEYCNAYPNCELHRIRRGLHNKYIVMRADGTLIDGFAFVLRIKDHHARVALLAYAQSVNEENPELASDLIAEVNGWYKQTGQSHGTVETGQV